MKGTALSAVLAATTLLASPVFAADNDLCALNMQKINDQMATTGANSEGLDDFLTKHIDEAKAAQASGDKEKCITISSKVLERLNKQEKGDSSGS
ncbi:hypothetical protein G7009_13710 [Pseudomonas capeferrum]|uniref:hypothetical protein n=1 Tax=Pseudomonas capeferrum TaxID=1495066 RepID=UPI0015E348CA|nr:hypothetical protein [Pseudomonas capeferrum]MBA1202798.1 hypothetical protein [Pseudomonas capeferrum]